MREVSREWLEFLREQYPKGSRVRLTKMGNDPHPVPPGSIGTLKYIDDIGQFHVKWDNGRGLALIIGEDQFQILPPEPQTIKFYMPLTAQLYAYDDWGDLEEYGNDLDGRELRDYQSCIHEALLENQMPEEKSRGLMHWYDKPDGVNTKVQSVMLDVESRDGQLWGVAECKVNGTLLPEEKEALAEYISGQASDGWGEGFEQRAIKLNDGELYVSLWNSSNWSIQTEEERFSPDSLTRLPDLCWSVLPGEGTLICIKRGESGYTLTATDHHAVFSRQRVDVFKDDDVASTQSARQHKDATDLVMNLGEAQNDSKPENETLVLLIRRLTPLECERLQGFPDGWTDIEGASDSARYKALGNSVAIPCVDYVLQGIAWAITAQTA